MLTVLLGPPLLSFRNCCAAIFLEAGLGKTPFFASRTARLHLFKCCSLHFFFLLCGEYIFVRNLYSVSSSILYYIPIIFNLSSLTLLWQKCKPSSVLSLAMVLSVKYVYFCVLFLTYCVNLCVSFRLSTSLIIQVPAICLVICYFD